MSGHAAGGAAAGGPPMLTPEQVAERCHVSPRTVMRAIRAGELVASQLASRGCWRIRAEHVDAWLDVRANVRAQRAERGAAGAARAPDAPLPRPLSLPLAPAAPPRRAAGASGERGDDGRGGAGRGDGRLRVGPGAGRTT